MIVALPCGERQKEKALEKRAWRGFVTGVWSGGDIDVRDFIQRNYTPYEGDGAFLAPATEATKMLWAQVCELSRKERERGGVYDADTATVSRVNSHKAGYFNRETEKIVGLQTDEPFKRALQPFGGIRMAEEALNMAGQDHRRLPPRRAVRRGLSYFQKGRG